MAYVWSLWDQNISINQIVGHGTTLCFAAKWLHEDKMEVHARWQGGHKKMIKAAHKLLEEADAVVHYNGKKFDRAVLNKEFLLLGLNPTSPTKDIDLYSVVKKNFKFNSNKLDYVCQMLGLGSKTKHKGMDMWKGVLDGNEEDQKAMLEYNVGDVVLLERLYDVLLPWINNHPNHNAYNGGEHHTCTNCGGNHLQRRGTTVSKSYRYQRYQCRDCGTWQRERVRDSEVAIPKVVAIN